MVDRLSIEATGFEFLSTIDAAARQLEQPGALMNLIGATMEYNINERFITKTDPAGNAWLPLAASTLKRKKGFGSLLVGAGLQADPKTGSDERMQETLTYNAGDLFVEVGFSSPHAIYHETGTERMPRRQLLTDDFVAGTLGQQDQADILAAVGNFLQGLGLDQ